MTTDRSDISEASFHAALKTAALRDLSVAGLLRVAGADALDLLHRLSTNDLRGLRPGSALRTVLTTDKGRILDCVRILCLTRELVLQTSMTQVGRVKGWIEKYTIMEDVTVNLGSHDFLMVSVLGPDSPYLVSKALGSELSHDTLTTLKYDHADIIVDEDRGWGIPFMNIFFRASFEAARNHLNSAITALGVPSMEDDSYEAYRVFLGIPGADGEISEAYNPLEVGLGPWISFSKGCYIGQEVIARLDTYDKVQRKLIGMSFPASGPMPQVHARLAKEGEEVGILTSVASVSVDGRYFGLAVARKDRVSIGDTLAAVAEPTRAEGVVTGIFDRHAR